jgi:hypothetical protein
VVSGYDYSGTWRMVCIGPGPGPKNVLAERVSDGLKTVVPYAIWKHKLSKEETVSEPSEGVYVVLGGIVQQFKKDGELTPVTRTNAVNNQNVSSFTVKTFPGQKLVSISLWSEFQHLVPSIVKGAFVAVEGKMREETKNGVTYYNVSASQISVVLPVSRVEREVVNAAPEAVAQPVAEQAAPAPAAASGTIF